jgi:hypothetical protein
VRQFDVRQFDVLKIDVLRSASPTELTATFEATSTDTSPAVFADTSPALSTPSLLPNECF